MRRHTAKHTPRSWIEEPGFERHTALLAATFGGRDWWNPAPGMSHAEIHGYTHKGHDLPAKRWSPLLRRGAVSLVRALGRVLGSALRLPGAAARGIVRWRLRRVTYRELMALDDQVLKDIGLHRSEIPSVVEDLLAPTVTARTEGGRRLRVVRATPGAPRMISADTRFDSAA